MTVKTLEQAVEQLSNEGVPTDSVIRSAQHINEQMFSKQKAQDLIKEMTGETVDGEHVMFVPQVYGYLVQNILKAKVAKATTDLLTLLVSSKAQAAKLIEEQSWLFIADEEARQDIENADPAVVIAGKAKKGARKVLGLKIYRDMIEGKDLTRKEAIAILQEQVGLTDAGGSTYYANFKSGKWA
jgi:hypothetical protein